MNRMILKTEQLTGIVQQCKNRTVALPCHQREDGWMDLFLLGKFLHGYISWYVPRRSLKIESNKNFLILDI